MNGEKADMVFTDPPYGVSYEEKALRNGYKGEHSKINADAGVEEASIVYGEAFKRISENIKDGAIYYVCSPQGGDMEMMMMMMRSTIPCRHQLIWRKDSPVFSMGRLDYDYQHEPILYGWKGSHKHIGGGKFKTSVWDIPRPKSSKLHPTMKPVELIVEAIKDSTKEGDIIIDLFGGSGSTLIACEQTNRTCYMMELDPKYCDVIRKRYENFIKKTDKPLKIILQGGAYKITNTGEIKVRVVLGASAYFAPDGTGWTYFHNTLYDHRNWSWQKVLYDIPAGSYPIKIQAQAMVDSLSIDTQDTYVLTVEEA